MSAPPTFLTHLRDAAFHARNAARSLDRAQDLAPSEAEFSVAVELAARAESIERECREAGQPVGSGAR